MCDLQSPNRHGSGPFDTNLMMMARLPLGDKDRQTRQITFVLSSPESAESLLT